MTEIFNTIWPVIGSTMLVGSLIMLVILVREIFK